MTARGDGWSPQRRVLVALLCLLAPFPLWAALVGRDAPDAAILPLVLVSLASPLVAGVLLARIGFARLHALGLSAAAYVVVGVVYALARPGGEIEPPVAKAALWPMLVCWQDLCRLGLWGCPMG